MEKEIFKYPDTNSSRAGIASLNTQFENQMIAIIGLGGTGSYILDLVAKTHVAQIHLYDADTFQVHNAFRAPGACSADKFEISDGLTKVDYYSEIYGNLRNGVVAHPVFVGQHNISEFNEYDFVFISVDNNETRSFLTKALLKLQISFIDVGMGVERKGDKLLGTIRVSAGTPKNNNHLQHRIGEDEIGENEYSKNIQIVELNCLNAALAVIRWKKMVGYYQDLKEEFNSLYCINTGKLLNEDYATI